jgi:hypothetical protein
VSFGFPYLISGIVTKEEQLRDVPQPFGTLRNYGSSKSVASFNTF